MEDRLISAKHVYELMDKFADDAPLSYGKNIVKNAPTVDAVRVVRCKDCKWWYRNEACTVNAITVAECLYRGDVWESNEFCSEGERREDE